MSDLAAGVTVAGYRIESLIGRGASGSVYLAHELSLDRRVALKTLLPELAADERFRERFLRESRIAAALEHPGILPIYATGEADGVVYLAMRFVDGNDLGRLIESEGPLDPESALDLLAQVADALDAAHRRGLVHRDVKPGNILVDETGRAYLTDFGLAKHAASVNSLTRDSPFAGTIDYIAPEQARGEEVDGRTDVYSLGCVLYETLTAEPPFRRGSELASVLAHLNDPPPATGTQLDSAIAHALAKGPDDRPATATALIDEARGALGGAAPTTQGRAAQLRTFLIADVRGYTRYTQEHGDEAAAALAAQFAELVDAVVSRRDGRLLELRGDEALVVFESARKALQAAVELQQRATELPRGIGIGLDAGEAVPVGRGYRGAALNTAARLCAKASPGEILASEGVVHLAGTVKEVGYGLRRQERLKGLDRPVTAVEIVPAGTRLGRQVRRRVATRARGTSRRMRLGGIAAAALVGVGVAVLLLTVRGGNEALAANSVAALDAHTGKTKAVVPGSTDIGGFIRDGAGFWGITAGGRVLQQVDGKGNKLGRQIALPVSPIAFAPNVVRGSIWATDPHEPATVLRIDTKYGTIQRIDLHAPKAGKDAATQTADGIDATKNAVWVTYAYPKRIARINPATNEILFEHRVPDGGNYFNTLVAADGDNVWVVDRDGLHMTRIDSSDGTLAAKGRLHGGWVEDARVAGGSLWLAVQNDGGVWQLDKRANVVGKVATGDVPYSLATDGGPLWVANANSGTVTGIDPVSGEVTQTFRTGHRPIAVGAGGGEVWVSLGLGNADAQARVSGNNVVHEAGVGNPYFGLDPAVLAGSGWLVLMDVTGARLTENRPRADGTVHIVPEIATRLPETPDRGRTWNFTIKKGYRFSPPSGAPVTAQVVRSSLERALSPKLVNSYCRDSILSDIAGEKAYVAGHAQHISGITVTGDRLSIRLVAPSWTLPARVAMPCFSVVPPGTPADPDGIAEPIPSAGPYYIDDNLLDFQLVLKKNPNYAGTRPQRVDGVIVKESLSPDQAAQLVSSGKADYAYDDGDPPSAAFAPGGRLNRAYGGGADPRYVRKPANGTRFLMFNTTRGPMNDVRLRHAVALALDRQALAGLIDSAPRSLFLSPGVPGYAATPEPGPRVAQARALLRGRTVPVTLIADASSSRADRMAAEVKKELDRAGFRVHVLLLADPWTYARNGGRADLLLDGWSNDYPDAQNSFTDLLDPRDGFHFYPAWFTDAHWLGQMRAAAAAPEAARAADYRRLDRELASGPLPATGLTENVSPPQFFSARVTCASYLPQFFGLADPTSLCLNR